MCRTGSSRKLVAIHHLIRDGHLLNLAGATDELKVLREDESPPRGTQV